MADVLVKPALLPCAVTVPAALSSFWVHSLWPFEWSHSDDVIPMLVRESHLIKAQSECHKCGLSCTCYIAARRGIYDRITTRSRLNFDAALS